MNSIFNKPHIFFEDGDIEIDPTGEDSEYGSGVGGYEPYACCYQEWIDTFWDRTTEGSEAEWRQWLKDNDFVEPEGCKVNP